MSLWWQSVSEKSRWYVCQIAKKWTKGFKSGIDWSADRWWGEHQSRQQQPSEYKFEVQRYARLWLKFGYHTRRCVSEWIILTWLCTGCTSLGEQWNEIFFCLLTFTVVSKKIQPHPNLKFMQKFRSCHLLDNTRPEEIFYFFPFTAMAIRIWRSVSVCRHGTAVCINT